MTSTRIALSLLLPDVPDARDACVARLTSLLLESRGITHVHVAAGDGRPPSLCLHYDPALITLAQVERTADAAGTKVTGRFGHALIGLRVVAGEDAARRVEEFLGTVDGVLAASVNLAAQTARVEFDRERTSLERIERALVGAGYRVATQPGVAPVVVPARAAEKEAGWYGRHKELVWSLLAFAFLAIAWVGERWGGLSRPVAIAVYLASYAFGGFDLLRHAVKSWVRGRFTFDIDLLMLIAAVGAAALGEWAEGAFLLGLFSFAHALEHLALDRARGAIRALADLAPAVARVVRDGREVELAVEQVSRGDVVVVRPGERIPVDGTVRSGQSSVDQAPITGESVPVDKEPGSEVFAGTINGDGALHVETTRAVGDRTLDRVVTLVEEAQTRKAPTQRFTDRFESIFVPTVLIVDVLLITVPPLLGIWDWKTGFYRGMALLVAASPCALALGTPAAILAAIAQAARNGVLIKGGGPLEHLGRLDALAFDKTGTLTVGKPEVTDVVPVTGVDASKLLSVAAAVERRSHHPIARAIVRRAEGQGLAIPEGGDLENVSGRGVRSSVEGVAVEIGNLRLWEAEQGQVPAEVRDAVDALQAKGRTIMAVRHGSRWLGVLGVADRPREGVRAVLDRLRRLGIKPLVMLTGDNPGVGAAIGREVGVDEVRADLLPEDKVTAIQELLKTSGVVAMVGDGVNDAPALAHATVGVAMGGAGTAVALETADAALMGDDLGTLPFAVELSRAARRIIFQNLAVALGVIALLIVATTTGYVGIGPAVVAHEGSTLLVLANALRLLAFRGRRGG